MDSKERLSPRENVDSKVAFRKPSLEVANRKYRHRSPSSESASSEGSPNRQNSLSPSRSRNDPVRTNSDQPRRADRKDFEKDSGRGQHGHNEEFHRISSRSSRSDRRHDDYDRHERHVDNDGRLYSRSRRESVHNDERRSRDYARDSEKYYRDRSDGSGNRSRDKERDDTSRDYQKYRDKSSLSDRSGPGRRHDISSSEDVKYGEKDRFREDRDFRGGKTDARKSYMDHKGNTSPSYEESRGHHSDVNSRRDAFGHRLKEGYRTNGKEVDVERYSKEEKKKYDERDNYKDKYHRDTEEKKFVGSIDGESPAKKSKFSSADGSNFQGNDVSKPTVLDDQKQSSISKEAEQNAANIALGQGVKDSDIDAAKVAAMKAAELVNRNLIGTGFMSTEQKKKLLWGNKKSTTSEESARHWDTTIFGDQERQEKFNKLMSLRLPWYLWPIVGCKRGRKGSGTQAKQPRCGETTGAAPVGFGEAIHCWAPSKRWSYSWAGSVVICLKCLCMCVIILEIFSGYHSISMSLLMYSCSRCTSPLFKFCPRAGYEIDVKLYGALIFANSRAVLTRKWDALELEIVGSSVLSAFFADVFSLHLFSIL